MPSLQETFDTVVKHLLTQNKRSEDRYSTGCKYKTSTGLKCAVGCLIPDDKYSPEMEGSSTLFGQVKLLMEDLGHDISLLGRLQGIHDSELVRFWPIHLTELASEFDLNDSILKDFKYYGIK